MIEILHRCENGHVEVIHRPDEPCPICRWRADREADRFIEEQIAAGRGRMRPDSHAVAAQVKRMRRWGRKGIYGPSRAAVWDAKGLLYRGERKPLAAWCRIKKLAESLVRYRLHRGWTAAQALETPPGHDKEA